MLAEELCRFGQRLLGFRPQISPVVIKIDVAHVLVEQLFIRRRNRGGGRGWRRLGYSHARGGVLRASKSAGHQKVVSRLIGRDALRSAGINLGAVQRDIGRVFSVPRERGTLSL